MRGLIAVQDGAEPAVVERLLREALADARATYELLDAVRWAEEIDGALAGVRA